MTRKRKRKSLEELNVMDDFLMNAVASDPKVGEPFCRSLLSVLLQRKIGKISLHIQSTFPGDTPEYRGIRMDVEVTESLETTEDGADCCIYDIEPQNRKVDHLPKRSRFYQAKLDSKNLESGEENWNKLPKLYIIMITNYDPFGEGYMMYTVRNKFDEFPDKAYEDGLTFIYFNTEGTIGGNIKIHSLLKYLKHSIIDNVTDETTQTIHNYVEHVKQSAGLRGKYMTINEILKAEKEDGRIEGACDAMKAIGLSNSEIIQKLGELYQLTAAEAEAFLEP